MVIFPNLIIILLLSLGSINLSIIRHPQDVFSTHKTFVESHRGVNREIFQNTLPAIERAIQYGVESFETDIWLTKDNILVVLHGGNKGSLEGYYNHTGFVTDLTWDELKYLRSVEDNLPMPKLEEVLELTKDKIFMNLEIKDDRYDQVFPEVINLLERYDFFTQTAISSFHHKYYDKIVEYNKNKDINHQLVFGFLYNKNKQSSFDFTKKGNTLNIYWADATKEICDKAHENGMAIQAWFSMTDEEDTKIYKQLIKNGADIICTNMTLLAKKFRDNYYDL